MRRALAIDEASYGKDHPLVAIRLNNLAQLLKATNRLTEAEPLMLRALAIFTQFQKATGHEHPTLRTVPNNYALLLGQLGRTQEEIAATLHELDPSLPDLIPPSKTSAPANAAEKPVESPSLEPAPDWEQKYAQTRRCMQALLQSGFSGSDTRSPASAESLTEDPARASELLTTLWEMRAELPPHIIPRILWLQFALALLGGAKPGSDALATLLGRLKTALKGEGVILEWSMEPALAHLKPKLSAADHALLTALVAALSAPGNTPALDAFPLWTNTQPVPLDGA